MSVGGATFDLFVHADHSVVHDIEGKQAFTLPLGTKIRVQSIEGLSGGGACNTLSCADAAGGPGRNGLMVITEFI